MVLITKLDKSNEFYMQLNSDLTKIAFLSRIYNKPYHQYENMYLSSGFRPYNRIKSK